MKVFSRTLALSLLALVTIWAIPKLHVKAAPAPPPPPAGPHPVITITNCQVNQPNYPVGTAVVDVTFRVTDNSQVAIQFLNAKFAKQGTNLQFAAPTQDAVFTVNPPPTNGTYYYIVWHNPQDCTNLIGSTKADKKNPKAKLKGRAGNVTGDPNDITVP